MHASQFPEIPEAVATGRIAALYADIRQVTGVGLVNLIYRHLAIDANRLALSWACIRGHLLSGALARQAGLLRGEATREVGRWLAPGSLVLADPQATAAAHATVEGYNKGNCQNLMALVQLLQARPGKLVAAPAQAAGTACAAADAPTEALPSIPSLASLDAPTIERIERLNRFGDDPSPPLIASLYRHLALWPALLAEVETVLAPLQASDVLMRARQQTFATALRLAAADPLPMPWPADAPVAVPCEALELFARGTISKMTPIGLALDIGLRPAARPGD